MIRGTVTEPHGRRRLAKADSGTEQSSDEQQSTAVPQLTVVLPYHSRAFENVTPYDLLPQLAAQGNLTSSQ